MKSYESSLEDCGLFQLMEGKDKEEEEEWRRKRYESSLEDCGRFQVEEGKDEEEEEEEEWRRKRYESSLEDYGLFQVEEGKESRTGGVWLIRVCKRLCDNLMRVNTG